MAFLAPIAHGFFVPGRLKGADEAAFAGRVMSRTDVPPAA